MDNIITYEKLIDKIKLINSFEGNYNIMEVCGTHTMAISKFGIRSLLGENINLVSGPGCPVCVTPNLYIDYVYDLALNEDVIIATYGDMIRVPGSKPERTLENAKAKGAKVKMVYSSLDAVKLAADNKDKKVVFLGIGFETTTPATAIAVKEAYNNEIKNFYILSLHKLVEPVMRALLEDKEVNINGFICPGHVAAVLGEDGFRFLEEYKCPGVITGFKQDEIVDAIYYLVKSIKDGKYGVTNAYKSLVKSEGNKNSRAIIDEVFETRDDAWRGIGVISQSGLRLKEKYKRFDIESYYPINFETAERDNGCKCGEVLKGKIKPSQCSLFRKVCSPENPIGPCMVSSEGSCAAYYRFEQVL